MSKGDTVIDAVEAGTRRKTDIAKSFSLPKTTVSTILKNKDQLLESYATQVLIKEDRLCQAAHPDIGGLVHLVQKSKMHECSNLGSKVKAKELVLKLGHDDFVCSCGWLHRFKSRHGIIFRKVTGEEGSVSEDMVMEWNCNQLPLLLREFSPNNILMLMSPDYLEVSTRQDVVYERRKVFRREEKQGTDNHSRLCQYV